jgi:hypothetical protein
MPLSSKLATSLALVAALSFQAAPADDHSPAATMADAANAFLAVLDDRGRAAATFPFDDPERSSWKFVPAERKGLSLKEMVPHERALAHVLLSTGLSHEGYAAALNIISLEKVLADLENNPARRDPELYFVSIFGTPSHDGTWGWRFEGHHLSLNFTIVDGTLVSLSPALFAANPGLLPEGQPRAGLRLLADVEDSARALIESLSQDQRAAATFAEQPPNDILTSQEPEVAPLPAEGIAIAELSPASRQLAEALVHHYLSRHHPAASHDLAGEIIAELDHAHFAWAGGHARDEPHYYRIQGKSFLLEYANVQNGARHPHTVLRRFEGDFGRHALAR